MRPDQLIPAQPPQRHGAETDAVHGSTLSNATVGVVVTTFNDGHFLADALESACAQTRPSDAIVVVDDGSRADPTSVTARFPNVRLIRRENGGLAAARNTGLAAVQTDYVVFLDADDRLEPNALDAGLACFASAPECGFVYGGHRSIDRTGALLGEYVEPVPQHPYEQLLRSNFVAMHGAVMYRCERLRAVGGFDERQRLCEDYELYLRMVRQYRIAAHPQIVAVYRRHPSSMSSRHLAMLRATLAVHGRFRPVRGDARVSQAWADGRRFWRRYYAEAMAAARYRQRQEGGTIWRSMVALAVIALVHPVVAVGEIARAVRRRIARPPDLASIR